MRDPAARAIELLGLFHPQSEQFAVVRTVDHDAVPSPYRELLDHRSHMTVAMEQYHGGAVRLRVVQVRETVGDIGPYAREILLHGPDGRVVQYGIVRLDLAVVDADTAAAVRGAKVPIGRVLIDAGMLRDVHDVGLVEVVPGAGLAGLLGMDDRRRCTYGRVAEISLAGRPALELLEIVGSLRD